MDYRILVTPASVGRHDPLLREQLETAVGEVIYNQTQGDCSLWNRGDRIYLDAACERFVIVTNAPGAAA